MENENGNDYEQTKWKWKSKVIIGTKKQSAKITSESACILLLYIMAGN